MRAADLRGGRGQCEVRSNQNCEKRAAGCQPLPVGFCLTWHQRPVDSLKARGANQILVE
jgi:hypothetical protein